MDITLTSSFKLLDVADDKEDDDDLDLARDSSSNGSKLRSLLAKIGNACEDQSLMALKAAYGELRKEILLHGVSDEKDPTSVTPRASLRGLVWKVLIGIDRDTVSARKYKGLILMGKSAGYDKIRSDSFRTFPLEESYQSIVTEESLIRLLNSFTHAYQHLDCKYIQGMNALAGMFLYTMPELDAFHCFSRLITKYCPMYWVPDIWGPKAGCVLFNQVLKAVDQELYDWLKMCNCPAELFAFPLLSTMYSCAPPFLEVLKLWDFLLAFGLHLNLVCILAQVLLLKDKILATKKPYTVLGLRDLPQLDAEAVIRKSISIMHLIPNTLMEKIQLHLVDPNVCAELMGTEIPRLKLIENLI
eukprot:TRINITY_DN19493_c0_g1_i2.p1 TRINITY_DN19493_c0_g1~~TRINITY_DN19493_c0_g1_i2.p1  ORF type:complete len:376 (+),score=77.81 TRINITY_DN19493_c0_g1_i2:55-1128(+)